jgi:Lon protease-like protein
MKLPIMPLNSVLFPGMPMPLFIFEQRYREMLDACREEESPFGISLIREGLEVGGPACPWDIGTTAHVVRVQELDEGGLHVLAVGRERFRLLETVQYEPYLVGEVALLDEGDGRVVSSELQDEIRELFSDHLRLVLQLVGQPGAEITIPESAARLSYMVAAHLTCPPLARQRLLEMDSLSLRFVHEKQLLQRESEEYRILLATRRSGVEAPPRDADQVFSLN